MAGVPASVSTPQPAGQYGDQAAREAALAAVPMGAAPQPSLLRPTERPDQPVTAGAPIGPGPGPEALAPVGIQPGSRLDLTLRIRAIASRFPNANLLALLRDLEAGDMPAGPPMGGPPMGGV